MYLNIPLTPLFRMPQTLQGLILLATLSSYIFVLWNILPPLWREGGAGLSGLSQPMLWFTSGMFIGAFLLASEVDDRLYGEPSEEPARDAFDEALMALLLILYVALLAAALPVWDETPADCDAPAICAEGAA